MNNICRLKIFIFIGLSFFNSLADSTEKILEKNNCTFRHSDEHLVISKNEEQLLMPTVFLSYNESVTLRCSDISTQILIGSNYLTCGEKGWDKNFPRCEVLRPGDPRQAPVVEYTVENGDHYVASNGSLMVSENANLVLGCWWFRKHYGENTWKWSGYKNHRLNIKKQLILNAYYEIRVDGVKTLDEGIFSCVNPKGQAHDIDVRVISNDDKQLATTAITTIPESSIASFTLKISPADEFQPSKTSSISTNNCTGNCDKSSENGEDKDIHAKTDDDLEDGVTGTASEYSMQKSRKTTRPVTTMTSKTKLITRQPPTTLKEEYLTDECTAQTSKDLVIYENGVELQRQKFVFPSTTSLVFRCRFALTQKMTGINKVQCIKRRWSHSWPTCDTIRANDWYSPPPVSVAANTDVFQLDNGDYLLPRGGQLYFLCFFYHAQPEMYVNNVLVKKYIYRHNGSTAEEVYWYVNMGKYYTGGVFTFKCYVPRNNRDEKYANSVTARFGDRCLLSDEEKKLLQLRFPSVVILPSSLRPVYVEGDVINFACNKTVAKSTYIAEGIRCAMTGIWELQSRRQTLCD